jgi:hypothetical protein
MGPVSVQCCPVPADVVNPVIPVLITPLGGALPLVEPDWLPVIVDGAVVAVGKVGCDGDVAGGLGEFPDHAILL